MTMVNSGLKGLTVVNRYSDASPVSRMSAQSGSTDLFSHISYNVGSILPTTRHIETMLGKYWASIADLRERENDQIPRNL